MSKFKPNQFEVKTEVEGKDDQVRVVKMELGPKAEAQPFHFEKIKRAGEGDYAAVKAKYGALAATDPDRAARSQKDARFILNPLLRDPLSVEQEERRVIEERVRQRVAAVAEEVNAEAAKKGYADGHQKGYEEAYRKFTEEGAGRMKKFEAFLAGCESAKEEIFRANERFLIEMIYRVARLVILRELTTDKEYLLRLSHDLIERVGVRENIRIRIHPDDMSTAVMLKEGLEKSLGAMKNFNIEASNAVTHGGCMIETEWNAIDASVDTQLAGIHEAITGSKASEAGGPA